MHENRSEETWSNKVMPGSPTPDKAAGTAFASTLVAVMTYFASTALSLAAPDPARPCIIKATEALPKISGLEIKRSRTRPMSAEQLANWSGQSKPIIVDVDTFAGTNSIRLFARPRRTVKRSFGVW
jgi:hypothetical protein